MIKSLYFLIIPLMFIGLSLICIAGPDDPMMAIRYEQYPAKNILKCKPAAPILETHDAKQFETTIREGAASGPNFAGEYTIVTHGCGACCKAFFVVNARTGKVYEQPFYIVCHYKEGVPGYGLVGLDYCLDSKLLIIRGARNEKGGGEYYYLWDNDQLNQLKSLERSVK